jgi:cellulose synthase (UDP-forming)
VIRAQLVIGMAAGAALLHTFRRRSAGWVPTGSGSGRSPLATKVMAVALAWLGVMTVASWAGVCYDVWQYGWHEHWGIGLYALTFSYLTVPLVKDLALAIIGRQPAGRRSRPPDDRVGWPERLMFTSAVLGLALLASGWVNPMLP